MREILPTNQLSGHPGAVQADLNAVLHDQDTRPATLGNPVTPSQWLRDLRTVTILLTVARDPGPLHGIAYGDAARHYIQTRTSNNGRHSKGDRTATQPPSNTAAAAGLLLAAQHLLTDQGPELNRLHRIAAEAEPVMWASNRNKTVLSDGLIGALESHKKNVTRPDRLRALAGTTNFTFEARHIPPYLDEGTFIRHFSDVRGHSNTPTRTRYERPLRRYAPIALTMLVTNLNATQAGALLGYTKTATDAGCARASEAFDHLGHVELSRRIIAIAREMEERPSTNWEARRNWFPADWSIPEHEWAWLQQTGGRRNTPWQQRREPITAWVWSIVTSSDVKDAPQSRVTAEGRTHSNGVCIAVRDLVNRGGPDLSDAVHAIALRLANDVDAGGAVSSSGGGPTPTLA